MQVQRSPFRIGRGHGVELVLGSPRVSKVHAEIVQKGSGWIIRDLNSRNGTFLNGERVKGEEPFAIGDILHVAHRELTFVMADISEMTSLDSTWAGDSQTYEIENLRGTRDMYKILRGGRVRAVFQAIVMLDGGAVVGFEALGRHMLPDADYDTTALFALADDLGKAVELSRLMRRVALDDVAVLPTRGDRLFINVHPAEMSHPGLLDELSGAASRCGDRTIVAEIHESVIAGPAVMRRLKDDLESRGIELAYDDFGAGTSRLVELAEVPPDFVKLDMSIIRSIDTSPRRQDLVSALVKVMRNSGVQVVAEGIETIEEHTTCLQLGCQLGQGFLIRHPAPAEDLRDTMQ